MAHDVRVSVIYANENERAKAKENDKATLGVAKIGEIIIGKAG